MCSLPFSIQTFRAFDGAELHYVDVGSGQAMVYVCGFGSTIESQAPFISAMAEVGRIIVFDQRAFGMTPAAGEMGIAPSARDVRALLEHLDLRDVVLYGYSMGAAVTFSYVEQFGTDRLSRVILGDMSPKLINEDGWTLGLYQGAYTRSMYEEDLALLRTDYKRFALRVAEGLLFPNSASLPLSQSGTTEEIRARILAQRSDLIAQTLLKGMVDITAEGLLFPNSASLPLSQSGTTEEIRARILAQRSDLIAQTLLKGMVDITAEHMSANYHYWSTMAGADFRTVLPRIDVPAMILYADPGSAYRPETAAYMSHQIPRSSRMPLYGCTHMAASENPMQWRGCVAAFAYG